MRFLYTWPPYTWQNHLKKTRMLSVSEMLSRQTLYARRAGAMG